MSVTVRYIHVGVLYSSSSLPVLSAGLTTMVVNKAVKNQTLNVSWYWIHGHDYSSWWKPGSLQEAFNQTFPLPPLRYQSEEEVHKKRAEVRTEVSSELVYSNPTIVSAEPHVCFLAPFCKHSVIDWCYLGDRINISTGHCWWFPDVGGNWF